MEAKCLRCAELPACAVLMGPDRAKEAIQELQRKLVELQGEPLKQPAALEEPALAR